MKKIARSLSFDVLKIKNFRSLALTRMMVTMALQCQAVIVGWQVYSITHDPLMLGLTGLIEAVPAILSALFAGYLVDIGKPHHIYKICLGVLMLNTAALLLVAGGYVTAPLPVLWWIYGGVFISGVARSYIMPSSFSLLSQIVPKNQMPSASAWLGSGFQVAAISGPAIAGIIYGGHGAHIAWWLPMTLMVVAFGALLTIKLPPAVESAAPREPAFKSIRAGWVFIWHNKTLLSVMALDMFAVLFGGAVAMLPAFADQILHIGPQGLGQLRAAPAIGAIIMALTLAVFPLKRVSATRLLFAVTGFGICMIGFGLSKVVWASALFLALSGMFDSVSMVIRGTLMQLLTPDTMRGRVSSVNSMFIISSNEIGAFESGLAARAFGLVPSVVLGGVGTLLVVGTMSLFAPRFRKTVVEVENKTVS